ncbi:hypothetical protein VNI00_002928 [Paramarasmius palmivorus]|uniref:Cytochrome P450 n=1 Tax=Paramarasmius palmivorus TaxID=297713 RepID=A0AAW0DU70_9AGAR
MEPYAILLSVSCLVVLLAWHFGKKPTAKLPPGPKPLPVVGNMLDIPSAKPWEAYMDYGRLYGQDIVHFKVFGRHSMIVNSRELAGELFEKRSRIYSDRPYLAMFDLYIKMGWADVGTVFMPYGSAWRQHRRLIQEGFRDSMAAEYLSIQSEKTYEFLTNLLEDPNDFRAHIRTLAAATIMGIVYGHDVTSADDYFVNLAERAAEALTTPTGTSAIVNIIPFMRHFPAWFPGCGFQNAAREIRGRVNDMMEKPYSVVVNGIASPVFFFLSQTSGTQKPSLLAKYLDRHRANNGSYNELAAIKQVCASAYGAGSDTTASALATFFLSMATHPHIQKRAQEHIDNLLSEGRLPTWADHPQLQYIEAIMRETLRWQPVTPLGFFHSATSDDTVNGYFIPKGTALSGNIWAMTRDPIVYPDPERFNPERFLTEDGTCNDDDVSFTFGFG